MKTLLSKSGKAIEVSDERAEGMLRDNPGVFTVVADKRAKRMTGISDKMLRTVEAGENK